MKHSKTETALLNTLYADIQRVSKLALDLECKAVAEISIKQQLEIAKVLEMPESVLLLTLCLAALEKVEDLGAPVSDEEAAAFDALSHVPGSTEKN